MSTFINAINECLDKDEQVFDFYELNSHQNGYYKYQHQNGRLVKYDEKQIPNAIAHQIAMANNTHYFGGFFEAINRAYFVVNSSVFLWDYSSVSQKWVCLNQFSDDITAIGLVKAKEQMFIDQIQYLLVVATKQQIMLIGIGFADDSNNDEIEATVTKYALSLSDNVIITKIIADKQSHRIFLGDNKSNVYEFEYSIKTNLWGQQTRICRKTIVSDSVLSKVLKYVALDDQMIANGQSGNNEIIDLLIHEDIFDTKCLFSLSANASINGYKIYLQNEKSQQMTKVLTYSQKKLLNEIQLQIQQMTDDNQSHFRSNYNYNGVQQLLQIVGLFQIDKHESQNCQLMAVTANGDRLFFRLKGDASSNAWNMELSFIRIRPPYLNKSDDNNAHQNEQQFEPSVQATSPKYISSCFYKNGVTMMNSLKSNNTDCLLLLYRNDIATMRSNYHRRELIESIECDHNNNHNNDKILAITQMSFEKYVPSSTFMLYSRKEMKKLHDGQPLIGLSQFSVQHLLPSTKYLCLRSKSISFYKLQRCIDNFKINVYNDVFNKNYEKLSTFYHEFGLVECQIMYLLLMINENDVETYKRLQNDIYLLFQPDLENNHDILYRDIMQRLNCQSTKLLSTYLCLSRILRPIWSLTICVINVNHNNMVSPRYSSDELIGILNPLNKFIQILDKSFNQNNNNGFARIVQWISKCIQILYILITLTQCQFNNIYDDLGNESKSLLKHITFEQLLIEEKGDKLLKEIISSIIPKLNDKNIEDLHKHCPTYFSTAQFVTFLAKSQLKNTSTLQKALEMLCKVCHEPTFDIADVCKLLCDVKYYNGVCELVFCLQNKLMIQIQNINKQRQEIQEMIQLQQHHHPHHPHHQHLAQHSQQLNALDVNQQQLNQRIVTGWQQIFKCLKILFVDSTSYSYHGYNKQFISHQQQRILALCLKQSNVDFAYKLYQWFLNENKIQILFKYKPKHFEQFLSQSIDVIKDSLVFDAAANDNQRKEAAERERKKRLEKYMLFLQENGETNKLIKLLDGLTKCPGFSLQERNIFLIEAKRAAKSLNNNRVNFDPHNVVNDRFNRFDEKSALCQIQLNLFNALMERTQALDVDQNDQYLLNNKLLTLDQIYEISKKYQLFEYCLDCLSFTNTNDEATVQHINVCWISYIANVIQTRSNGEDWTTFLKSNFPQIVNKYNLQQQPWMFNINQIVLRLNQLNLQTHHRPSNKVVVDIMYPNIKQIQYSQLINCYKHIFNQIEERHKVDIMHSIYYLITLNPTQQQQAQNQGHAQRQPINPRLLCMQRLHDQFDSVSSSIRDLRTMCIAYLRNIQNDELLRQFQSLHY